MTERNTHPDHQARLDQLKKYTIETVHGVRQQVLFDSYPEGMEVKEDMNLEQLSNKVVQWHHDRNLIEGSSDKDQTLKLLQELGELSDSVCKGKDIKDDIGDMLVVMLNITTRNGVSLEDCLARAWQDIKDRKGRMVDGIFVKETDL
tara:strand:- start:15 stop:455 length:441 start_codon:yes stop_codon:yes gene_type:complete